MDNQEKEKNNISRIMKYYRQLQNMSQEDLSKESGINLSTIKKYEVGIRNPKHEQLEKIAEALGINVNHFYDTEYKTVGDLLSTIISIDKQTGLDFAAVKDDKGNYDPDSIHITFKDENVKNALAKYLSIRDSNVENSEDQISNLILENTVLLENRPDKKSANADK